MDDSPRTPRVAEAGQFYDWIDLSSQMALSFRMLSRMNAVLGRREAMEYWHGRAEELGALINAELWCPRTRFYHDRMLPNNFVGHKTVAAFWPILAEICPATRLEALIEHLQDPEEFNRRTPVPSLAADDANYCPWGTYWVGGVWAPTNYMITRGLMRAEQGDVAHAIAMAYLGGLARTYKFVTPHTLWECYSAEEDLPGRAAYTRERVKPDFVGWSGIGPIAMLIENVLGIDLDAPAREVHWTLRLTEEHGIRQLAVPGGHLDLLCAFRGSPEDPAQVEVQSDAHLTIHIDRGEMTATVETQPGRLVRATV
jgi:glycogen debranching enzyme